MFRIQIIEPRIYILTESENVLDTTSNPDGPKKQTSSTPFGSKLLIPSFLTDSFGRANRELKNSNPHSGFLGFPQ